MSGQSLSLFEQIRNRVQSQDTGEHGSRRGEEEEQRRREFEALLAEKRAKEEELKRVQVNLIDVQICIKCYQHQQEEKQRAAEELEARRLEADKKRARLLEEVVKDHDGDGNGDDNTDGDTIKKL